MIISNSIKLYFDTDNVVDIFLKEDYLFSWDKYQGKDRDKFIRFLREKYNVTWIKNANIEETDGGRTIKASTKINYLSLRLNNEKTKATKAILTIDNCRTDEFDVLIKNGTLNVYGEPILEKSKEKKIEKAKELWNRWSGEPIRISPYLIGEFIAASSSERYRYSLDEIFNIINNKMIFIKINDEKIPKCKIIHAKLSPNPKILNMPIFEKYGLLHVDFEGEATISNKPQDRHQVSFVISKDFSGKYGKWDDFDKFTRGIEPGLSFINEPEITISSTYFELEFFRKASEFAL
jgi:hypothetical protein